MDKKARVWLVIITVVLTAIMVAETILLSIVLTKTKTPGPTGAQGIQGPEGEKGDQGVGVENAYINSEKHLILVLTDGSEIDAGSIDEPIPEVTITRAEWIDAIVSAFEYEDIEGPTVPSFSDIDGNEYMLQIEKAVSNGLLSTANTEFNPNGIATREFAVVTAIKAMEYIPSDDIVCDDYSDIENPEYAKLAIDLQLVSLKDNKFLPNDAITGDEKDKILSVINETINSLAPADGSEKGFVYRDNVLPLFSSSGYSMSETNDLVSFTESGSIRLPYTEELANLEAGQIIAVDNKYAYKITSYVIEDEYILIDYTEPEIHEVLEELDIAGQAIPELSQFQPSDGVVVTDVIQPSYASGGGVIDGISNVPLKLELEVPLADNYKLKVNLDWSVSYIQYGYDINFLRIIPKINNAYFFFENKTEVDIKITKSGEGSLGLGNVDVPSKIVLGVLPFIGVDNFGIVAQVNLVLNAEGAFEIKLEIVGDVGAQILNNVPRKINTLEVNFNEVGFAGEIKAGPQIEILAEIFNWDLISITLEVGASAMGEAKLRSNGMVCMDVSFSPYLELTLFEDTLIDDWLNCAVKLEILANNSDNPFRKTGIHMENVVNIVESCTYRDPGTISGIVVNADNRDSIQNAKIEIYDYISGNLAVSAIYSNEFGEYSVETDDGTYKIVVSAEGYIPFEIVQIVRAGEVIYVQALLMVEGSEDENITSKIGGTINNAVTGIFVSDVKLDIRKGWNQTTGEILTTIYTNEYGMYEIELPLGNYTIVMSKEGYITNHFNAVVTTTSNLNLGGTIVPNEASEIPTGDLRIVLRWGTSPSDLDSHLLAPTVDGTSYYHIAYYNEEYYYNGERISFLDVDDINGEGPETITVYSMNESGIYRYYVHNYSNRDNSNSTSLSSSSNAYVQVYVGEQLIAIYHVPAMQVGTLWHVFNYDAETGRIISVNEFSSVSDPKNVGE